MPRIYYTANNYFDNYSHVNTIGEQNISCSKLDLFRSMITVGTPSFLSWREIKRFGLFRALSNSIFQKILLVHDNIGHSSNNMCLHPIFDTHVTDQKRIVSYNLGMAFAKLYAETLLNIPNLIHVETLKKTNSIEFQNTNRRTKEPDLVGMTADGNWHVFEAKGMTSSKLNTKINEAKEQARQIDTIHDKQPETLSACATYFSRNKIVSRIEDPKGENEKKIEIDFEKYINLYYDQFFALTKIGNESVKNEKIENIDFKLLDISINSLELTIGIETEINDLIKQKNYSLIHEYYSNNKKNFNLDSDQLKFSIGQDGFIVKYKNNK